MKWLRPVIIIFGLWLFSLLAGAQPSILRSAVMFTCIVIGETLAKKTSIYNTLAFSAFVPALLESLLAVGCRFSTIVFGRFKYYYFHAPIYNLFYIKNKILDFFWKLNAVTIAAQILTLPLSIYHFHQFPVYFLLTNFIAVPLSSIILFGKFFFAQFHLFPLVALLTGEVLILADQDDE